MINMSTVRVFIQNNPGTAIGIAAGTAAVVASVATYFAVNRRNNKIIEELPAKKKEELEKLFVSMKTQIENGSVGATGSFALAIADMPYCRFSPALQAKVNTFVQSFGAFHSHYAGAVSLSAEQLLSLESKMEASLSDLLNYNAEKKELFFKKWFKKNEKKAA